MRSTTTTRAAKPILDRGTDYLFAQKYDRPTTLQDVEDNFAAFALNALKTARPDISFAEMENGRDRPINPPEQSSPKRQPWRPVLPLCKRDFTVYKPPS